MNGRDEALRRKRKAETSGATGSWPPRGHGVTRRKNAIASMNRARRARQFRWSISWTGSSTAAS